VFAPREYVIGPPAALTVPPKNRCHLERSAAKSKDLRLLLRLLLSRAHSWHDPRSEHSRNRILLDGSATRSFYEIPGLKSET
jgi:hypothetical protein